MGDPVRLRRARRRSVPAGAGAASSTAPRPASNSARRSAGAGDVEPDRRGGGAYAGFNLQNGPIVGGIEGDTLLGSINGVGRGGTLSEDWISSLRIRGGWAFGPVLAYGTVGPAWATLELPAGGFNFDKSVARRHIRLRRRIRADPQLDHRARRNSATTTSGRDLLHARERAEDCRAATTCCMVGVGAHF